jgi:hypothetical protein
MAHALKMEPTLLSFNNRNIDDERDAPMSHNGVTNFVLHTQIGQTVEAGRRGAEI